MKYPSHDLHSLSKSGQTRSCLCYDNGRRVDARHNNNDDTTKTYTSTTSRSKVFSVCEPFVLKLPGCHFTAGYIIILLQISGFMPDEKLRAKYVVFLYEIPKLI